ncbi:PASTA domain-containing protein [Tropheryma whipplei]|uniref:PASTA domain-containing protein n=2 Tax=Tropheryma whipplei TaxID=2039 RepID=UPI000000C936|nr:PASTA domain-containing protein [Tropheryma whipplei]CAD67448.1 putative serine/threonine-protein kinase [Tropheryma whipplei TW08/27]
MSDISTPMPHNNRYELVKCLRVARYYKMYQGYDRRLKRNVNVVLFDTEVSDKKEFSLALDTRVRQAVKLDSPHIATIFDGGEDYFSDSIRQFIASESTHHEEKSLEGCFITISKSIRLIAEVIDGVALALEAGRQGNLPHGSISPQNITCHDGSLKVINFAIATSVNDAALPLEDGKAFFAPELLVDRSLNAYKAEPRQITYRSDVYSLGGLLYWLLTGTTYITGEQVCTTRYRSDTNEAIDCVLRKALAIEPTSRFSSAVEMSDALRKAIEPKKKIDPLSIKDEILAQVNLPHKSSHPKRKHSNAVAFIALAICAVAAVITVSAALITTNLPDNKQAQVGAPLSNLSMPNLIGIDKEQAIKKLNDLGVKFRINTEHSATMPVGYVTGTSPKSGAVVDSDTEVSISLSDGMLELPNFVGARFEAARRGLAELRLEVKKICSGDTVNAQKPAGGSIVPQEIEITLETCSGASTSNTTASTAPRATSRPSRSSSSATSSSSVEKLPTETSNSQNTRTTPSDKEQDMSRESSNPSGAPERSNSGTNTSPASTN